MKKLLPCTSLFLLFWVSLAMSMADAAEINITVKNLTHGTYFTPLLVTAHGSGSYLFHAGVLSADDGLAGSSLNESHRWDNPVARITVTRIK